MDDNAKTHEDKNCMIEFCCWRALGPGDEIRHLDVGVKGILLVTSQCCAAFGNGDGLLCMVASSVVLIDDVWTYYVAIA